MRARSSRVNLGANAVATCYQAIRRNARGNSCRARYVVWTFDCVAVALHVRAAPRHVTEGSRQDRENDHADDEVDNERDERRRLEDTARIVHGLIAEVEH